jgi:branched-chain amino acid transport system substrate-binding protein
MLLLASTDDGAIFKQAGEALGERFLFVAPPVQIPNSAPPGPARDAIDAFLKEWQKKYPDRDPTAGARAWDSMMVIAKAAEIAKSVDGTALRDAVEKVPAYQGAFAAFHFSADQHAGIIENPFSIAVLKDGKLAAMP